MKLNWINAEQYNMETFLLFDRWMLRCIFTAQMEYEGGGAGYVADLAKAFSRYPVSYTHLVGGGIYGKFGLYVGN